MGGNNVITAIWTTEFYIVILITSHIAQLYTIVKLCVPFDLNNPLRFKTQALA